MWTPYIYQHLAGIILVGIACLLYYTKTDKEVLKAQGKRIIIFPLTAAGFYIVVNFIWTYLALRGQ